MNETTKTYRRHRCTRQHRTYRTLANCIWPRAEWISGEGEFASIARCRVLTVMLFRNLDEALLAKACIDSSGCGGGCPCTGWGHEIVHLVSPGEAIQWERS